MADTLKKKALGEMGFVKYHLFVSLKTLWFTFVIQSPYEFSETISITMIKIILSIENKYFK